ncbi:type 4b pilus protein PilO2 [Dickeya dadantii]|uniref:type 4b pilus protein PilO2 n=1 Tax=Dickeya dadantii TaxID=204038 RepID=UPI001495C93B|nr:type 4b pilus protein PilO2 [Dickeya dadantii]NPE55923.1 type 4b pilus protein PilO2 [Dickeya dadantii]NPE67147.1 type 4b pilus protein PilO2 [Dickeya dadantii]
MSIKENNPDHKGSGITVITYNRKKFVVGLRWLALKNARKPMDEAKIIGKEKSLDVVSIRRTESAIQAGFAPKGTRFLKGYYSLASALVSLFERGDWIGIFSVPNDGDVQAERKFIFIAGTADDTIVSMTDQVISESELSHRVNEISNYLDKKATFYTDVTDIDDFPWNDNVINLDNFFEGKKLSKSWKLKPLTFGLTRYEMTAYSVIGAMIVTGGISYWYYLRLLDDAEKLAAAEQKRLQFELSKQAAYNVLVENLKHPWISTPSVNNFIRYCDEYLKKYPLSMGGRVPTSIFCDNNQNIAYYAKYEDGAVGLDIFRDKVKEKFNVDIFYSPNQEAFPWFILNHKFPGNGDDPIGNDFDQKIKIFSILQKWNVKFSSVTKPLPNEEVKIDKYGNKIPVQDWIETDFSFELSTPPRVIFRNENTDGVRLSSITYKINNDTSEVTYSVKGVIYARYK